MTQLILKREKVHELEDALEDLKARVLEEKLIKEQKSNEIINLQNMKEVYTNENFMLQSLLESQNRRKNTNENEKFYFDFEKIRENFKQNINLLKSNKEKVKIDLNFDENEQVNSEAVIDTKGTLNKEKIRKNEIENIQNKDINKTNFSELIQKYNKILSTQVIINNYASEDLLLNLALIKTTLNKIRLSDRFFGGKETDAEEEEDIIIDSSQNPKENTIIVDCFFVKIIYYSQVLTIELNEIKNRNDSNLTINDVKSFCLN